MHLSHEENGGQATSFHQQNVCEGFLIYTGQRELLTKKGRLKTRNWTSRDHQNCWDWHRETGQCGTI